MYRCSAGGVTCTAGSVVCTVCTATGLIPLRHCTVLLPTAARGGSMATSCWYLHAGWCIAMCEFAHVALCNTCLTPPRNPNTTTVLQTAAAVPCNCVAASMQMWPAASACCCMLAGGCMATHVAARRINIVGVPASTLQNRGSMLRYCSQLQQDSSPCTCPASCRCASCSYMRANGCMSLLLGAHSAVHCQLDLTGGVLCGC